MKMPTIKLSSLKLPKIKIYGIDVIKNFLFFTFYIILTLFIIATILKPSVQIFKQTKTKYFNTKNQLETTKSQYEEVSQKLKTLTNSNQKILNALKREFNLNNFKLFAKDFMKINSIKKEQTSPYKDKFIKTSYLIKATIKSPKNFYDFIDASKNYKNLIRVYFPFDFVKNKNDINLTFKIEVYNLKNKLKADEKAH